MTTDDDVLQRSAWFTALSFGALAAFSGFERQAFDAPVHMFFASHYVRDWFELFEPRWYSGFSVVSYPPLAHQLVALTSRLLGYEGGYVAVMVTAMVVTPWCVGQAAQAFVSPRAAGWAMLVAALFPTAHRFAWVYGQLPMLVATPFALLAMNRLHRVLSAGRWVDLLSFMACVGATSGAHHVSSIFVALGCLVVGLRHVASPEDGQRRGRVLVRGVVAAGVAAGAIAGVIWPFWRFAQGSPQTEIPHISRDPLWLRPVSLELVELVAVIAIASLLTLWAVVTRRWTVAVLTLGALGLAVLATGRTTPLPQLLFRSQAAWLTYDKFHHWASLLLAVGVGAALQGRRLAMIAGLVVVLVPPTAFLVGHKSAESLQPPYVFDISGPLAVFNGPEANRYRHLALGFGDQFCRFDIYGQSPSADGDYHTARTDPMLRASGVATLDASKYYPTGFTVLSDVLARAPALSLRWVLVNDEAYYPPLLASGFEIREVWENGITLFERDDVPAIAAANPSQRSWHWGSVPLGVGVLAMLLVLSRALKERAGAGLTSRQPPPATTPAQ